MKRRFTILLVGALMATLVLAVAGMASAQAVGSPTINPTPDNTSWTNGLVYSMVRSGDYVYVGGKFTRVVAPSGESFGATNLARFDAATGAGDKGWTPKVTGADMTKVNVYLNFQDNTEEAFEFYRSVFGGEFSSVVRFKDMPMEGSNIPVAACSTPLAWSVKKQNAT